MFDDKKEKKAPHMVKIILKVRGKDEEDFDINYAIYNYLIEEK